MVKGGSGVGSLAGAATPPPVPEEKLHGKDLLDALKKQVGWPSSPFSGCFRLPVAHWYYCL